MIWRQTLHGISAIGYRLEHVLYFCFGLYSQAEWDVYVNNIFVFHFFITKDL